MFNTPSAPGAAAESASALPAGGSVLSVHPLTAIEQASSLVLDAEKLIC